MRVNQTLSEDLKVKPLTGEEVIRFKLVNAFRKEVEREGHSVPEVYALSRSCSVVDPYAKGGVRTVVIGNVVSEESRELPDGSMRMFPKLKPVEFIRGFCTLTANDNGTYEYLMRRKDNESNKFRNVMGGKGKKMTFKIVDDKDEIAAIKIQDEMRYEAEKLVREMRDPVKIKALASKLNTHPNKAVHIPSYNPGIGNAGENIEAIKMELISRTKLYAKIVIYSTGDATSMLKVQIAEALNFGVLYFDKDAYYLLGSSIKELHKPDAGEDKLEDLMKFLMSEEGAISYQEFSQALKKALTGTGSVTN